MIVSTWPAWFRALTESVWSGGSYCAFDLETSGYSRELDVITEFGHVLVRGGKVISRLHVVVDWTGREVPPDSWLRDRLEKLRYSLQRNGSGGGVSYAKMKRDGIRPEKALAYYHDLFELFKAQGTVCVAHNGYGFDETVLESNFAGFDIASSFDFGDNGLLDTDLLERANQLPTHERTKPWRDDTLRTYFKRLGGLRLKGLKSNLDTHCFGKYKFAEHGVNQCDMHQADVDAYCLHIMLEEFRRQLAKDVDPVVPAVSTLPRRWRGQRNC